MTSFKSSLDPPIHALFVDIGGVLLTDGWNRQSRKQAVKTFGLDPIETEERHHLIFETYESGKLSLEDYLSWVVFYKKRPFSRSQFRKFMFAQSKPFPDTIELVQRLKDRYRLKVVVVSNEAREINDHRIKSFALPRVVDCFISSCFVHIRKPDPDIFRLALDIAHVPVERVVYLENTPMFVQVAESMGIRSILHTGYKSTREKLASLGLFNDEKPSL